MNTIPVKKTMLPQVLTALSCSSASTLSQVGRVACAGRGNFAILCCFASPEAAGRKRQHGSETIRGPTLRATQVVPAADLQAKLGCSRMLRLVDKPTMSRLALSHKGVGQDLC